MNSQNKSRKSVSRRRFIKNGMIAGAAAIAGSAACTDETCSRKECEYRDCGTGPGDTSNAQTCECPDCGTGPGECQCPDVGTGPGETPDAQSNDLPRPVADGESIARGSDLPRPVATAESIKAHALVADFWNPIWRDADYASKTRWGAITAAPMYLDPILNVMPPLDVSADKGFLIHNFLGEDLELFEPVYINDSFTIYLKGVERYDVTPPGADITVTGIKLHDKEAYNQKNEKIATYKLFSDYSYLPEAPDPDKIDKLDDYIYTKEELDYVQDIINQEEIRGADIRYWEDVNVGDETKPVSNGPTTLWCMFSFCAGRQEMPFIPTRVIREMGGVVTDPVTGVTHNGIEWHLVDKIAHIQGEVHAFQFGAFARQQMARLATNWMGDDGFIRKYSWRHLKRTPLGDTCVGKGRVIGKRIENGEYLVDLDIWLDNICRGNVTEAAKVTVSLLSKNNSGEDNSTPSTPQTAKFEVGDRVLIKDRNDWSPKGYQLANAEGTVIRLYPWVEVFEEYQEYIAVEIDKADTDLGIGNKLMFRAENLEKI